jgi:hypothetical protein
MTGREVRAIQGNLLPVWEEDRDRDRDREKETSHLSVFPGTIGVILMIAKG